MPDSPRDLQIQVDPPGPERVFRVESEATLELRVLQEYRQRGERAEFPAVTPLGKPGEVYGGRCWPGKTCFVLPNVTCYSPLYFEDLNVERYGWEVPIFQPAISTGQFYVDLVMLPYNMGVLAPWDCECNSGYFLPGDPVPYYFYIPPLSWKGAILQAAVVGGAFAILP